MCVPERSAAWTTVSWDFNLFHARADSVLHKFVRWVARCASTVIATLARVLLGKFFPAGSRRSSQGRCPGGNRQRANTLSLNTLLLQRAADIGCMHSFRNWLARVESASAKKRDQATLMATMCSATRPLTLSSKPPIRSQCACRLGLDKSDLTCESVFSDDWN